MHTPDIFRPVLFVVLFVSFHPTASAQNTVSLHRFDAKIESFYAAGKRDSFMYYAETKASLAKQADSLALWAWTKRNIESFIFDSTKEAIAYNQKTLQERWRTPADSNEWRPFLGLNCSAGWHYYHLGQLTQAIKSYETAAEIYEKYRYPSYNTATLYNPLGNHYTRLGDNDKALAVFQKALAIKRDNESEAGLYSNIGIAYWNKGDYAAAETNYRKGLSLPDVSPLKRALLLGALAQTQLDKGNLTESATTAAQSLALLRTQKPEGPAVEYRCYSRRTAGVASTRLGRYKEAEQLLAGALKDALESFGKTSRDVGKIEVARSQLYLVQGRLDLALDAANRALSAVIPSFQPGRQSTMPPAPAGQTNPNPTQFYEENTIFEALTAKAAAAKALYDASGDVHWLELALECHDLAWKAESILRRVFQYSSSKLNLQKDARNREEAAMNVARLLFEKTGQMVWLEKAFSIAERSKAVLLLEALQDNFIRQRLSGSDKRFDELTTLRQGLSYFEKNLLQKPDNENASRWRIEIDGLRGKIAILEQSLRKEYPNLFNLDTKSEHWLPMPSDFSSGEALAGYFMSEHWLDVFVFQNDRPAAWHRIPNDEALQGLIRRYLAFFENDYAILNDPTGYFQTAYTLWQKILPQETASAAVLTILPDGILNFLPFDALVTALDGLPAKASLSNKTTNEAAKAGPSLRNAAYLLRQQEVRYAYSLAVLRQQKNLQSKAANYLLSVAPGFENHERGLAPLASANFGWLGIEGWDIQNLKGQNADLQHFLSAAGRYRVLHFSTHAFAGDNPRIELMDSSLLLPDLYALPLQADLVMLSACETGLGKEEKGEGVMSLARAFAQAGAACIVSSLWSVNDQSTSRLLGYFYEKIGQGHTSGAALREAKLAYLADSEVGSAAQSPYFWAGLVAVGDDRAVAQPWGWGVWGIVLVGALVLFLLARRFSQKLKTSKNTETPAAPATKYTE